MAVSNIFAQCDVLPGGPRRAMKGYSRLWRMGSKGRTGPVRRDIAAFEAELRIGSGKSRRFMPPERWRQIAAHLALRLTWNSPSS
jgi:hypothetical protein